MPRTANYTSWFTGGFTKRFSGNSNHQPITLSLVYSGLNTITLSWTSRLNGVSQYDIYYSNASDGENILYADFVTSPVTSDDWFFPFLTTSFFVVPAGLDPSLKSTPRSNTVTYAESIAISSGTLSNYYLPITWSLSGFSDNVNILVNGNQVAANVSSSPYQLPVAVDAGTTISIQVFNVTTGETGSNILSVAIPAMSDPIPAYITNGKVSLCFNAADATSITSSSGLVSQWNDQATGGYHATATSTARPTTGAATRNGRNVIRFNGTSNALSNLVMPNKAVPYTVWLVARCNGSTGSNQDLFGGKGNRWVAFISALTWQMYGGAGINTSITATNSTWRIIKCQVVSGTSDKMAIDGTTTTGDSGDLGFSESGGFVIGANLTATASFSNVDFAHIILSPNNDITDATMTAAIDNWLKYYWGFRF